MTSWGLTRATVRNQGWVPSAPPEPVPPGPAHRVPAGPACSVSQWAALAAMIGAKCTPGPAPPTTRPAAPSPGARPRGPRRSGVLGQPVGGVGRDDRVEVHAGAGPPHEVAVVPVP